MLLKELFIKIDELARREIELYNGPSLKHYELSIEKGIELATKLNADIDIVKCGCALMDIKLGQCIKENRQNKHIFESKKYSLDILNSFNINNDLKEILINCVEVHHGNEIYKTLEAEIVANADCYRFIHPIGFFTFFQTVTKRGLNLNESIDAAINKLEEKHKILSLDIVKNELEHFYIEIKEILLFSKE